jgi:hypothetical protein
VQRKRIKHGDEAVTILKNWFFAVRSLLFDGDDIGA